MATAEVALHIRSGTGRTAYSATLFRQHMRQVEVIPELGAEVKNCTKSGRGLHMIAVAVALSVSDALR